MSRILLAALLGLPALASAADRHVGVGYAHATIQGAVNAATDGDVIVVHAGTYAENVVVDAAAITNLTIQAYPGDVVKIDAPNDKVVAIIANTVNLRIRGVVIEAPANDTTAPRGINFISTTAPGAETFTLTLCDVTLQDHGITGGRGINCVVGTDDTLALQGDGVTISRFPVAVGSTCGVGPGWEDDVGVCSGW